MHIVNGETARLRARPSNLDALIGSAPEKPTRRQLSSTSTYRWNTPSPAKSTPSNRATLVLRVVIP
jgi:hypothetical protein